MREPEVFGITTAAESLTREQSARAKRYFISMMARTACFILAVITPSPWRWFFLLGAVFLPYFAVVLANATRTRSATPESLLDGQRRALS
jgi:Flp pilus assembly protein TadB